MDDDDDKDGLQSICSPCEHSVQVSYNIYSTDRSTDT